MSLDALMKRIKKMGFKISKRHSRGEDCLCSFVCLSPMSQALSKKMAKSTLQNLSVFFWIFYIHSTQKPLQLLSKFPATAQVGIRSGLACAAIVFKHAECKCFLHSFCHEESEWPLRRTVSVWFLLLKSFCTPMSLSAKTANKIIPNLSKLENVHI